MLLLCSVCELCKTACLYFAVTYFLKKYHFTTDFFILSFNFFFKKKQNQACCPFIIPERRYDFIPFETAEADKGNKKLRSK